MTQVEVQNKRMTIVDYIKMDSIVESAERNLGARGQQFLTSILSFATSNPKIMECEPRSVYTACLTAATLDLPINQNLGFAYVIPYSNKGKMEAQFQMGYKGFIQLAIRTGKYLRLGANKVFEGQLTGLDDFSGEPIFNFNAEHNETVVGYMAYFELTNGFRKASFMSLEKVEAHGKKYSQSYKKNFGPWKDDFEGMAKKTVLKLLLSKFAPLSTQLEEAIVHDQKVADEYLDNKIVFEVEEARINGELVQGATRFTAEVIEVQSEENYLDEPIDTSLDEMFESPVAQLDEIIENTKAEPKKPLSPRKKKAFAMLGSLPKDVQEKAEEGRHALFGDKSRANYTADEVERWIDYLATFEEAQANG